MIGSNRKTLLKVVAEKAVLMLATLSLLACGGNLLSDSDSSQVNGGDGDPAGSAVRFDALPIVNTVNAGAYEITGTCLSDLGNVLVTVSSPESSLNGFCTNDRFSVIFDLTTITSSTLSVTLTQGPLTEQLAVEPPVDLVLPTVTINTPDNIGVANEANYSLDGTCSEEGRFIILSIGGLNPSSDPVCNSGVWSLPSIDLTSLAEGSVDITANHTDISANYAVEATATVTKALIPPVFHAQSTASTGGSNINAPASPAQDLIWTALTISDLHFSLNPTNTDEITVLQDGDYRLSLTLPMQTGVQRSNVATRVKLNSVQVQGAYSASSYIRNISNHNSSSNHIDVILNDLSIGDVIEVQVEREAAAGTTSIVTPAQLFIEPVDPTQTFVATSNALTSGTNLNVDVASPVALEWTSLKSNASYSLSGANPEDLTINDSGHYLVSLNIPIRSNSARVNIRSRVILASTDVVGSSARQGYMRRDSGHDNSSIHWQGLIEVSAGEVLRVEVARDANSGTVNFLTGQSARLSIERVSSTEFINLQGQNVIAGTNWNQNSTVDWDTETAIDSSLFTHNTSANSDEITLVEEGDYFIVYSDSLASNSQRSAVTVDVVVNGTPTGLKCDSHYIRSSSGHNESSCSLSGYLRSLNAGDTITVETSVGGITGNTTSNDSARLMVLKK